MKKCPFCAEEIQDDAIKCKHCSEFIVKAEQKKWYFGISVLVIAILCVGPLALPLLWFNPQFSKRNKIVISVIVIILTYILYIATARSLNSISQYYRTIFQGI